MNELFTIVGIRPAPPTAPTAKKRWELPIASIALLSVIILGCLLCDLFSAKDPSYMDLHNTDIPPCSGHLFGTDSMGRDIFSMIWHGGRVSLFIGFFSAVVSTAAAILIGTLSGLAPKQLDGFIMRLTEIFLSTPDLLLIIFLGAIIGKSSAVSIALTVGITGWAGIAKVVRAEVKKLRQAEYVIAARCMGAGYVHILRKHLLPSLIPSVMFMAVMNMRNAIIAESTLSFMGLGLPIETVSWGSMLSLAQRNILAGTWQSIVIPGIFMVVTLVCITDIGSCFGKSNP